MLASSELYRAPHLYTLMSNSTSSIPHTRGYNSELNPDRMLVFSGPDCREIEKKDTPALDFALNEGHGQQGRWHGARRPVRCRESEILWMGSEGS
jgi:hypothetical protein